MSGRTPDEGRYSKVSRRMWDDERFRELSKPPPNAQTLWQRLLTGPELGCIPGLFSARQGGLADALGWPVESLRDCWTEIAGQKMAEADWSAGLVWVPNAIVHNEPQSTNAIIGWRLALRELPECDLKRRAIKVLRAYLTSKGEAWGEAFRVACGEASAKATNKPSAKPKAMASPMPSETDSGKPNETPSRIQEQESGTGAGDPTEQASPKDLTGDRAPRPFRRAGLVFEQIRAESWAIPGDCIAYATALGLSEQERSALASDLRQKILKPQTDARLVELYCRFAETKAQRKASGAPAAPEPSPEARARAEARQKRLDEQKARELTEATAKAEASLRARGIDPAKCQGADGLAMVRELTKGIG